MSSTTSQKAGSADPRKVLPLVLAGLAGAALSAAAIMTVGSTTQQPRGEAAAITVIAFDTQADAWLDRRIESIVDRLTEEFIARAERAEVDMERLRNEVQAEDNARIIATLDEILPMLHLDDEGSLVEGSMDQDALVVVAFGDHNCSFCKSMHETLKTIARDGLNGQPARVVHRPFPVLGEGSAEIARAVLGAKALGLDAHALQDAFYAVTRPIGPGDVASVLETAELDATLIMQAGRDTRITEAIGRNRAAGAALDIRGTPAFIVGRTPVMGAVGLEGLEAAAREDASRVW